MSILFETLRGLFLVITVFMMLLLVSGNRLFDTGTIETLHQLTMPAYLVLSGIVIGYILSLIGGQGIHAYERERNNTTAFIQGLIIGIFLALLYIFIG